jgi:DNA polymerase
MAAQTAAEFVPDSRDLDELERAAHSCEGCDLYLNATQTVFGAGSATADMMLVGEQPGDQQDKAGAPFVGPAGRLLDKALAAADVERERLYVTNAVKHFKFTLPERGQRRIHKTPSRTEVVSCRPWLLAEVDAVQPDVLLLLGATAAQSLMGSTFRLTAHRGEAIKSEWADAIFATVHPSAVLRTPPDARERAELEFFADIDRAWSFIESRKASAEDRGERGGLLYRTGIAVAEEARSTGEIGQLTTETRRRGERPAR